LIFPAKIFLVWKKGIPPSKVIFLKEIFHKFDGAFSFLKPDLNFRIATKAGAAD